MEDRRDFTGDDTELDISSFNADKNADKPDSELNVTEAKAVTKTYYSLSSNGTHHHHHHHHHHSRKYYKKKRRKKIIKRVLIGVGIGLLAVILAFAGIVFTMYNRGKSALSPSDIEISAPENVTVVQRGQYVIYKGERYNYNKDIITAIFMGIDKYDSNEENTMISTNHRADFVAVAAIDKAKNKISIINVPRDVICDVKVYSPGGGYVGVKKQPLATAFSYGDGSDTSCIYTSEAVSRIFYNQSFGMYFALNLDGVPELTDAVGGVKVVSPETIGSFVEKQEYELDGDLATEFVRRRVMDRPDANLLRNKRQEVYMKAFMKKLLEKTSSDIMSVTKLYNASEPYSITNLDADRVTYLATEILMNKNMKINFMSVPVEVKQVDNHAENYIKEAEFYEQFLNVFYNKQEQ